MLDLYKSYTAEHVKNSLRHHLKQFSFFLALDFFFVGSAWSFGFFIPAKTANDLRLGRISTPDLIHYIIFFS